MTLKACCTYHVSRSGLKHVDYFSVSEVDCMRIFKGL